LYLLFIGLKVNYLLKLYSDPIIKEVTLMGTGSDSSNVPVVRQAKKALDQFKHEIANELGLQSWQQATQQGGYYGYVPARDNGAVGGHMVRRMIEAAEKSLMEQAMAQVNAGFAQGFTEAARTSNVSVGSPNTTINSQK
jgi:hypothetical protein